MRRARAASARRLVPRRRWAAGHGAARLREARTADLPTQIMDFRWFDPSIISILRGGIPRPIGDFPESLTQAML